MGWAEQFSRFYFPFLGLLFINESSAMYWIVSQQYPLHIYTQSVHTIINRNWINFESPHTHTRWWCLPNKPNKGFSIYLFFSLSFLIAKSSIHMWYIECKQLRVNVWSTVYRTIYLYQLYKLKIITSTYTDAHTH